MQAFHSDAHALALPPGHRFPQDKYRMLREALASAPGDIQLCPAPAATPQDLVLAHAPNHVQAVLQGQLSPAQQREIGFPWSEAMVRRTLHSVGATLAAARAALLEGVGVNLAGGTHHASADKGSGYCVFNDVAVAARQMQTQWLHSATLGSAELQVLVIDLDVHQGNGTAEIFRDDGSVFTFSMHGERNFPFRKVASDLDVDLPDGCDDGVYLQALDAALAEVWQRFDHGQPLLAFYLAGADPHEGDRLGRLRLSDAGMQARDARVYEALWQRGIPMVLTMAGGYGADLAAMVAVQAATVRGAEQLWRRWQQGATSAMLARWNNVKPILNLQG